MQPLGRRFVNPKRPQREGKLVVVGRVEDLPEGRGATVELLNGKELALYNVGGQFHAVENFCPHKGAPWPTATSAATPSSAPGTAGASTCAPARASTTLQSPSRPTRSSSKTGG